MQYYDTLRGVRMEGPTSVAMGFFDGLHLGHAAVIAKAVEQRGEGFLPTVFTFTMRSARPDRKPGSGYELITRDDKRRLLMQWGVMATVCPDFVEFKEMETERFVSEVLVKRLRAGHVCCGRDFRFGKRAAGGVEELRELCAPRGITVDAVEEVRVEGQRVSSTWIRGLLREGDVKKAAQLLGRPFGYDFAVTQGKKLGRKLSFPTINQPIPPRFAAPRNGVYVSVAYAREAWRPAVTNVGLRPTVEHSDAVNSETYICGFSGDLYGVRVPVRLIEFLRPEKKFDSVEALREQIGADAVKAAAMAEEYLRTHRL